MRISQLSIVSLRININTLNKGIFIKQTENEIIVYNLPKNNKCFVYSIDGKLLSSAKSTGHEQTVIPIRKYVAGAYIIMADNVTYKILKK